MPSIAEVRVEARVLTMAKGKARARAPTTAGAGSRILTMARATVRARVLTVIRNEVWNKSSDQTRNADQGKIHRNKTASKRPSCGNQDQCADSSAEVFIFLLIYFHALQA